MIAYKRKQMVLNSIVARRGELETGRKTSHSLPAAAPYVMKQTDSRVILELYKKGAEIPVIVVPITRAREVTPILTPLIGTWTGQATLEAAFNGSASYSNAPLLITDIESEAFSLGCRSKGVYKDKLSPPDYLRNTILNSGLSSDKGSGRLEYMSAWRLLKEQYGLAGFRAWQEAAQARVGSPIFIAPTPMIKLDNESVDLAFEIGTELISTVETQIFEGLGMDFIIHSELFSYNTASQITRTRFIENLSKVARRSSFPTQTPFISMKIINPNSLIDGPDSRNARVILGEFLMDISEVVQKLKGIFILHNFGTWTLAGLDAGADIVSFRGDGEKFKIDMLWKKTSGSRKTRVEVHPFDSMALCNGSIRDFKKQWQSTGGFVTPTHVEPSPFWENLVPKQQEYRTKLIIDGLLDIGKEYRDAMDKEIPMRDAVKSRVSRMKEQDAMYDLCPSLGFPKSGA